MEYVVFWLLLSAIPALMAPGKNRSAVGWFFLSLVISPLLGIILIAVLPARPKPNAEPRATATSPATAGHEAETRRPCPHCAEMILPAAKVCRYCGRDVDPVEVETPQDPFEVFKARLIEQEPAYARSSEAHMRKLYEYQQQEK